MAPSSYPVVDIFAGPGGLGEGFATAQHETGQAKFRSVAAIERDAHSHQTLLHRHFFRYLKDRQEAEPYYDFLAGRITESELFANNPEAHVHAKQCALRISLGPETHDEVREIIRSRIRGEDLWVLVGGPPCQAYSLVGRSRMTGQAGFEDDERHTLYLEYLRIIADHQPPVFVMENVKGLLSAKFRGASTISRIVRDLRHPGRAISDAPKGLTYRLFSLTEDEVFEEDVDPRIFLVKAEDYGVPQARHRIFIVGIRSDVEVQPSVLRKSTPPTVRDTIGSLPAIRSGISKQKDTFEVWLQAIKEISRLNMIEWPKGAPYEERVAAALGLDKVSRLNPPEQRSSTRYISEEFSHEALRDLYDPRLLSLTAHESRSHMASDLRRYFFAATYAREVGRSPNLAKFPKDLLPDHQNIDAGRRGKMFSDRFRVQLADRVSTTITSHISKDGHYFIHYDPAQCRSLTVREAARLQTFPDNFYFAGPRTAQYHQVGNAVPPYLARQIADIIGDVLDNIKNNYDGRFSVT